MVFLVTIDVEEDNWARYDSAPALSNIERLPELQKLFDRYHVKPTYLITYPVATDQRSISILRTLMEEGRCEIGAHVHPWNTPPFSEERTVENTMLCNLGKDLQYQKIETLHGEICNNFHMEPKSFRSGRWGFSRSVAENIYRVGYRVDTSVSPYYSWEKYFGPDFSDRSPKPQCIQFGEHGENDSHLLEVPASIAFLQPNFEYRNRVLKKITNSRLKHLRLVGVLDKLRIVNKVMLSPETASGKEMILLAGSIQREGIDFLNMFFHSSTLVGGLTPFTKSAEDEKIFLRRIEVFLEYLAVSNIKSITLSESYPLVPVHG
jgi:peptidoglycan/xylan/chitin deacetylase (PgdA/CDA1 family)